MPFTNAPAHTCSAGGRDARLPSHPRRGCVARAASRGGSPAAAARRDAGDSPAVLRDSQQREIIESAAPRQRCAGAESHRRCGGRSVEGERGHGPDRPFRAGDWAVRRWPRRGGGGWRCRRGGRGCGGSVLWRGRRRGRRVGRGRLGAVGSEQDVAEVRLDGLYFRLGKAGGRVRARLATAG